MAAVHTNGQPFYLSRQLANKFCGRIAVLFLAFQAQEPEHLLYERLLSLLCKQLRQLKLRHSFVAAEMKLLNDPSQSGTIVAQYRWNIAEYSEI